MSKRSNTIIPLLLSIYSLTMLYLDNWIWWKLYSNNFSFVLNLNFSLNEELKRKLTIFEKKILPIIKMWCREMQIQMVIVYRKTSFFTLILHMIEIVLHEWLQNSGNIILAQVQRSSGDKVFRPPGKIFQAPHQLNP